jgi:serine protease Do
MRKIQNLIFALILGLVGGFTAIFIYTNYFEKPKIVTITEPRAVQLASLPSAPQGVDLTFAAEQTVTGVVHIQTQYAQQSFRGMNPLFDFFFGEPYQNQQPRMQQATGSGVIISPNGYIVTNNHVIEKSQTIKVTLHDKREYEARLIGSDPSTDIALLKIDVTNLPTVPWGNSDQLKLGEWVLAVGNPFNLTSTVTAGIVSARARGIGIGGEMSIEAFIQTDAAVNPGNSGGALVNTRGELIGINTAIASRTGSYSGYSFAVPVSIARKVVEDLKEFGEVQRALLGVHIQSVNADLAKELKLERIQGVYVTGVVEDAAASKAEIKEGDVIIAINNVNVNTTSELQEQISRYRPGEKVDVLVIRDKKERNFNVTLRNTRGGTEVMRNSMVILGAELAVVDDNTKSNLNIRNGLVVTNLGNGKLKEAGIKEGFIITHVNKRPVNTVQEINVILKQLNGGVLIEGKNKKGEDGYFVFALN